MRPRDEAGLERYREPAGPGPLRPGSARDLGDGPATARNKRQVTRLGAASFAPYFHPDGKRIIFSSNHPDPKGRNFDLYLVKRRRHGPRADHLRSHLRRLPDVLARRQAARLRLEPRGQGPRARRTSSSPTGWSRRDARSGPGLRPRPGRGRAGSGSRRRSGSSWPRRPVEVLAALRELEAGDPARASGPRASWPTRRPRPSASPCGRRRRACRSSGSASIGSPAPADAPPVVASAAGPRRTLGARARRRGPRPRPGHAPGAHRLRATPTRSTSRFPSRARLVADPWAFFSSLFHAQRPGHAAYLDTGRFAVASVSPELFFDWRRGPASDPAHEGHGAERPQRRGGRRCEPRALAASEKDRAENLMIVDMLRNDLGRVADPGQRERVRALRGGTLSHPPADDLVGRGPDHGGTARDHGRPLPLRFGDRRAQGADHGDHRADRAGAPRRLHGRDRIRRRRGGARASTWRSAPWWSTANSGEACYGVGSGVVADSSAAGEYAECLLKARILSETPFRLLETMRWTPEEGFYLGEAHVDRLMASAAFFGGDVSRSRRRGGAPGPGGTARQPKPGALARGPGRPCRDSKRRRSTDGVRSVNLNLHSQFKT